MGSWKLKHRWCPCLWGATPKSIVTHHNDFKLDLDLYLRIAPELYLKELIRELVLGFKRPWKRKDMIGTLEKLGVMFPPGDHLYTDETNKFLRGLCVKVHYLFFLWFIGILMRLVCSTMWIVASLELTLVCSTRCTLSFPPRIEPKV